jgi:hypothetical protein
VLNRSIPSSGAYLTQTTAARHGGSSILSHIPENLPIGRPFAQTFDQSLGGRQLRFVIPGVHVVRGAERLESSCDLRQRLFGHREIATPLGETP